MTDYDTMYHKVVKTIECNSAVEFLDYLSPRGDIFRDSLRGEWWIRGHSKHQEYKLLPTALRPHDRNKVRAAAGVPGNDEVPSQAQVEARLLARFVEDCNELGLWIPAEYTKLRDDIIRSSQGHWPDKSLVETLALARHHGLLTRLLDWTVSPFNAAYFAARIALTRPSDCGQIAVWAINTQLTGITAEYGELLCPLGRRVFDCRLPLHGNANAAAQDGHFTEARRINRAAASISVAPPAEETMALDEYVTDGLVQLERVPSQNLFYLFTLPANHGRKVLELVKQEGVSLSTLIPTYEPIVTELLRRHPSNLRVHRDT